MDDQNGMFFTIWYGVWQRSTGRLTYGSGGHHPAILLRDAPPPEDLHELDLSSLIIGAMRGIEYEQAVFQTEPGDRLYVFCDGVFEIEKPDGTMWDREDFTPVLRALPAESDVVAEVLKATRAVRGRPLFDDDYSFVELRFPATRCP